MSFTKKEWTNETPITPDELNRIEEGIDSKQDTLTAGDNITIADGVISSSGGAGTPIGSGMDYYGTTAPENYMFADGSAISRTEYAELFEIIGTVYGEGDGSTTFNLPDKRERVSVMRKEESANGTDGATLDTLGATGGEFTHTQTVDEMPSHSHTVQTWIPSAFNDNSYRLGVYNGVGGVKASEWEQADCGGKALATGGGQSMNNMQPYLVCNYIIKVK